MLEMNSEQSKFKKKRGKNTKYFKSHKQTGKQTNKTKTPKIISRVLLLPEVPNPILK